MQTDETRAREVLAATVDATGEWQDAEAIKAGKNRMLWSQPAIRAMLAFAAPPAVESEEEPVAYLKSWRDDGGNPRVRVDIGKKCEPWLAAIEPTIEPLYRRPPASLPQADREAIARVIDPMAWSVHEKQMRYVEEISDPEAKRWRRDIAESAVQSSLAKADAILALSPTPYANECICPKCGLRHGGQTTADAGF